MQKAISQDVFVHFVLKEPPRITKKVQNHNIFSKTCWHASTTCICAPKRSRVPKRQQKNAAVLSENPCGNPKRPCVMSLRLKDIFPSTAMPECTTPRGWSGREKNTQEKVEPPQTCCQSSKALWKNQGATGPLPFFLVGKLETMISVSVFFSGNHQFLAKPGPFRLYLCR